MKTGFENVDTVNGIIRGVSVITSGLIARGHDLEVDHQTLVEMLDAANARGGQVPVKVDHKSGAAAVCGYLCNFRTEENKLLADWHLLQSHPQREQILETAARMPGTVGLSAAFVSPPDAPKGKARCAELISVDYVTQPAANPDGLYQARIDGRILEFSADRVRDRAAVHRVVDAVRDNLPAPELPGLPFESQARFVGDQLRRHPRLTKKAAYATGRAVIGAAGAGLLARKLTKSGHGRVAATVAGGLAGAFLSANEKDLMQMEKNIGDEVARHAKPIRSGKSETHTLESLAKRVAMPVALCAALIDRGKLVPLHELSRQMPDGPQVWESDLLNEVREFALREVAASAVELCNGDDHQVELTARNAIRKHVVESGSNEPTETEIADRMGAGFYRSLRLAPNRQTHNPSGPRSNGHPVLRRALEMRRAKQPKSAHEFNYRVIEDEDNGVAGRLAKGAAVVGTGAALAGGAAYLRGRLARRAGASIGPGIGNTIRGGASALKGDSLALLRKLTGR